MNTDNMTPTDKIALFMIGLVIGYIIMKSFILTIATTICK